MAEVNALDREKAQGMSSEYDTLNKAHMTAVKRGWTAQADELKTDMAKLFVEIQTFFASIGYRDRLLTRTDQDALYPVTEPELRALVKNLPAMAEKANVSLFNFTNSDNRFRWTIIIDGQRRGKDILVTKFNQRLNPAVKRPATPTAPVLPTPHKG